jgi:hypothetical protein
MWNPSRRRDSVTAWPLRVVSASGTVLNNSDLVPLTTKELVARILASQQGARADTQELETALYG